MDAITDYWRFLNAGLAVIGLILLSVDVRRRARARREGWERRGKSQHHYLFSGFYWESMALLLVVVVFGSIEGAVNDRQVSLVTLTIATTAVVYQIMAVTLALRTPRRLGQALVRECGTLPSVK